VREFVSLEFAAANLTTAQDLAEIPLRLGIRGATGQIREQQLCAAIALRDAVRRSFLRASRGEPQQERDLDTINSFAADEPPVVRLTENGEMVRVAIDPVAGALAEVARDAVALIARQAKRLRVCARAGCGAIFLDASRPGRRRWCSMRRCGNREKVAGYRARQRRS
jgi:predicted RNA-binding Zn ribbon-like protein